MPLQWQNVDFPIGAGQDDNSSEVALPRGKPISLINGVFDKDGCIAKREGFSVKLGTAEIAQPVNTLADLFSVDGRAAAVVAGRLYDYSETTNAWFDRGVCRSLPLETRVEESASNDIVSCDAFTGSGYTLTCWWDGTTVSAKIVDNDTGAVCVTKTGIASVLAPQALIVAKNGNVYFFVVMGNTGLRAVKTSSGHTVDWDVSTFTFTSGLGTCFASRAVINPDTSFLPGNFFFAGIYTAGGGTLAVESFDPGTLTSPKSRTYAGFPHNSQGPFTVKCFAYTNSFSPAHFFAIGYVNTDGTLHGASYLLENTANFGNVVGADNQIYARLPKHVAIIDKADGVGDVHYVFDNNVTYGTNASTVSFVVRSFAMGAVSSSIDKIRSVSLASDCIQDGYGGLWFSMLYYSRVTSSVSPVIASKFPALATSTSTVNSALLICEYKALLSDYSQVQGRCFRSSALTMPSCSSASASGTQVIFANRVISQAESATISAALTLGAVGVVTFDTSEERGRQIQAFGENHNVGGNGRVFDGKTIYENNFHIYPEVVVAAYASDKGGMTNTTLVGVSTAYTVGKIIKAPTSQAATLGHLFMCVQAGTTAGVAPTYDATSQAFTTDGTVVWQEIGFNSPTFWRAGWAASLGNTVIPSTGANGFIYTITAAAGNTVAEPVWPIVIGNTVTTGAYTYKCIGVYDFLENNAGYTYAFCYSWVDSRGKLQRSALSIVAGVQLPPAEQTSFYVTAGNTAFGVTTERLCDKNNKANLHAGDYSDIRIEVYRTKGDGTVLQQIASLRNNPWVDAIGFVDTTPDTTQELGAVCYQGPLGAGEFANRPPPANTSLAPFGQRLVANDLETPYTLRFSKLAVEGFQVAWADELTKQMNGGYGAINALVQMDDTLVVFQTRAISLMGGPGPDNTGAGVDFGEIIPISTQIGCSNPSSVILTSAGVFFQSAKGIYLLRRDRSLAFVGYPVQTILATLGNVISAAEDPSNHNVIFVSDSQSQIVLSYDYRVDAWGQWRISSFTPIGVSPWGSELICIDDSGEVHQQTGWLDNGAAYLFSVRFAPARFDGLQGYGAVRGSNIKFYSEGDATINVTVYENDSDTSAYVSSPDVELDTGMDSVATRFRKHKMESVGLQIDETITSDGALVLHAVTFRIGTRGGLKRIKPAKRTS